MSNDLPEISIVVIGFNEGKNLANTFAAIKNSNYPEKLIELIYVDSGSTDNSVQIARQYCDKVFLEPEWPTAARNRNRGLIESNHQLCHFLDGDIEIDPNYILKAVQKLQESNVQAVFGYLEESSQKGLNRILLHDYSNRKQGYINAPGAGGTFIKESLIHINGWDERIPMGEEMEIGDRFLRAGYKIWFMDQKMGIHDYGITNFSKYLKRQIKEGISIGKVMHIKSIDPFFLHIKRMTIRNLGFHLFVLFIFIFSAITTNFLLLSALFAFYPIYLIIKYILINKIKNKDTIFYHLLQNLTKTLKLYGTIKYFIQYSLMSVDQKTSFQERVNIEDAIQQRKEAKTFIP